MTVEILRELNPELKIYSLADIEFNGYGRVLKNIDASKLIKVAERLYFPDVGSMYEPSIKELEENKYEIQNILYGELDTQIGYCRGFNSLLNAFEWHTSSEINVATTDFVLILAKLQDLKDNKINSDKAKCFYVKKGDVIEIYATTLHFCPCQAEEKGFGCIVGLPRGTNMPLENSNSDPILFKKNKWLIAHEDNEALLNKNIFSGISGKNIEIKYK